MVVIGAIGVAVETVVNAAKDNEFLLKESQDLRIELAKCQEHGHRKYTDFRDARKGLKR